jgi:hypothetical protein
MLISSLALVVTLMGWVRLAGVKPQSTVAESVLPVPDVVSAPQAAPQIVGYRISPLPTLVPLITPPQASARRAPGLSAVQPAPPNAVPALNTLRTVNAPPPPPPAPAPVAVTRSSR